MWTRVRPTMSLLLCLMHRLAGWFLRLLLVMMIVLDNVTG
jgi:hypothetical protein